MYLRGDLIGRSRDETQKQGTVSRRLWNDKVPYLLKDRNYKCQANAKNVQPFLGIGKVSI
jgi:hypothetical protein